MMCAVIVKCISRKSNVDQLIRYILTEDKIEPVEKRQTRQSFYVPGVKLSKDDIKHLEAEKSDAKLLSELKAFKGNIKAFINNQILKGNKPDKQKGLEATVIKHNLRARSINGYIKEFRKNEAYRQHIRKDNVLAFHTVLSFSALDSKQLNEKVLKDIAEHYISLRGDNSLYVGAVHQDKEHIHIHLAMSGVQYCTGMANRISRQQFQELKIAMQEYQRTKYPQLVHSLPQHGRKGKENEIGQEKNIKRNERTDKGTLLKLLETTYSKSKSTEHFLTQLQAQGHEIYYRNGRLQGIKYDGERKFRLIRLGYDVKKLQALDIRKEKEEKALQEIKGVRNRGKDIEKVIHPDTLQKESNSNTQSTKEEHVLQELADIRDFRDKEIEKDHDKDEDTRDISDDSDTDSDEDIKDDENDSTNDEDDTERDDANGDESAKGEDE